MEFDLSKCGEHVRKAQAQWKYLDTLASSTEEFNPEKESKYPSVKEIHNLAVLLLSLNFPTEQISNYISSKGIDKSIVTEHLIEAWKDLPNSLQKINSDLPVHFPVMQAAALLQSLNINIKLLLDKKKDEKINIGFASAVDFLYIKGDSSINPKEWIKYVFETASIDPLLVREIKPYPKELALSFDIKKENIVDFLAKRFEKIYERAIIFFQVINESTQFSEKFNELFQRKNSNRFAMNSKAIISLPIINATHEDYETVQLYFRDPIVSFWALNEPSLSGERHNRPYLLRIDNVTDKARDIIKNTFFERVVFPDSWTPKDKAIYFLRRKPEMLETLTLLTNEGVESLSSINFYEYLSTIGYPELKLKQSEYIGIQGLRKAVEFHSMAHFCFGAINVDFFPPFVSR